MSENFTVDAGDTGLEPDEAPRVVSHRGRPPKKAVRQVAREPARDPGRGLVVEGHNGEILTRRRRDDVDPFHIPPEMVPKGWTYQWNAISVTGNTEVVLDQGMGMYENGWRPVPADRHPGMFVPRGTTGAVIRGGLRLEERPEALTEDAMAESIAKAKRLLYDQNQSVMGKLKNVMPADAMSPKYRGTGGDMRMSIDKGMDIPTPGNYTLADDSA